jgi:flagellar hook-basal body complex protein FliE
MPISPAAAAAAYQSVAKIAADVPAATASAAAPGSGANFSDFLSHAINNAVDTMKTGEQMATKQAAGQADMVDVVSAVNAAELTLDTVVAVRDKVIAAYQSIMQMPI